MFKTKGGAGGQRLFEQCSKKTADLVEDVSPKLMGLDGQIWMVLGTESTLILLVILMTNFKSVTRHGLPHHNNLENECLSR